jgi:hypothetical protein
MLDLSRTSKAQHFAKNHNLWRLLHLNHGSISKHIQIAGGEKSWRKIDVHNVEPQMRLKQSFAAAAVQH